MSYKGSFLYITYALHAHYMNHFYHLHSSNYINIMNSSNKTPHYISFCVLLLLTPTIFRYSPDNVFSQSSQTHVTTSMIEVTFERFIGG